MICTLAFIVLSYKIYTKTGLMGGGLEPPSPPGYSTDYYQARIIAFVDLFKSQYYVI